MDQIIDPGRPGGPSSRLRFLLKRRRKLNIIWHGVKPGLSLSWRRVKQNYGSHRADSTKIHVLRRKMTAEDNITAELFMALFSSFTSSFTSDNRGEAVQTACPFMRHGLLLNLITHRPLPTLVAIEGSVQFSQALKSRLFLDTITQLKKKRNRGSFGFREKAQH